MQVYEIFTMHAVLSSYIYQHFIAFISTPLSMGEIVIENVTGMINSLDMCICVYLKLTVVVNYTHFQGLYTFKNTSYTFCNKL